MQVRWIASTRASWAHAASAIAVGRSLAVAEVQEKLALPVANLRQWLGEQGVPAAFWDHLPALAAGIPRNDELANVALTKTVGRDRAGGLSNWLAALLREIELPWMQLFPELTEQLALRSQPLVEQWEARGGVMRLIGNLTDPELISEQGDVVLVQPVLGGGGAAQLAYNSVRIEAVLANPAAELPEVARLAWLLAQIQTDLPRYRELLERPLEGDRVAALAMLPATLSAAADVELLRNDPATLRMALAKWPARDESALAETLAVWWETYQASRPPFGVALRALEEMLATGNE